MDRPPCRVGRVVQPTTPRPLARRRDGSRITGSPLLPNTVTGRAIRRGQVGATDRPAKQATRQEGTGVLELRESCVDELLTVLFKVQLSVRACPILGVESPTAQRLGCDLITLRKSAFVTSKAKSRRFLMPWGERVGRNKTYSRSRSRRSDS